MSPAEWAERTAQANGHPPRVTDPTVLARVAGMIAGTLPAPTPQQPADRRAA